MSAFDTSPFDPRDYLRALRAGGPMDLFVLSCRCLACGQQVQQSARWYHEHDMLCSCGGQFDPIPFEQAAAFIAGRSKSLPESVRIVPYVHEDSQDDR